MAEQHLHLGDSRPGHVGSICTALDVADAVEFAGQRTRQVGGVCVWVCGCVRGLGGHISSSARLSPWDDDAGEGGGNTRVSRALTPHHPHPTHPPAPQ